MTKLELRNEISRISQANLRGLDAGQVIRIMKRQQELMEVKGYNRSYLNKNEKKQYLEDYLETYINANYDITGTCL